MDVRTANREPIPAARQWVRGLWEFYRGYTHTAIHAASAAALTIFGLLVFIDPLFVVVAIAAYVCPPLVLYVRSDGPNTGSVRPTSTDRQAAAEPTPETNSTISPEENGIDAGTGSHGSGDTDSDSDGGDTDSDSDGGDTDSDSDGGDTDSDT